MPYTGREGSNATKEQSNVITRREETIKMSNYNKFQSMELGLS